MEAYHDEELSRLFRQIPAEKPSDGFSARVMTQIMLEAQRIAARKRVYRLAWAISIPCSAIVLLVAGYFAVNYWAVDLEKYFAPLFASLEKSCASVTEIFAGESGKRALILGMTTLVLLLGDLFLRRYAERGIKN